VRIFAIYAGSPSSRISPGVEKTVTDSLGKYHFSLWGQAWVIYTAHEYEPLRLVYPDGLVDCDSCCGQLKDVKLTR
jgi:hypothetical protein